LFASRVGCYRQRTQDPSLTLGMTMVLSLLEMTSRLTLGMTTWRLVAAASSEQPQQAAVGRQRAAACSSSLRQFPWWQSV
jgi:hypothetical protein